MEKEQAKNHLPPWDPKENKIIIRSPHSTFVEFKETPRGENHSMNFQFKKPTKPRPDEPFQLTFPTTEVKKPRQDWHLQPSSSTQNFGPNLEGVSMKYQLKLVELENLGNVFTDSRFPATWESLRGNGNHDQTM